jgi:type VI secretion system protein ImpM
MNLFSSPKYMGWFGKLPSTGDFAGRGLPRALQETTHDWISSGMAALACLQPEDWQDAYLVSPVWHFAVNSGVWDNPALVGCLAPSVDKIGRYSPLMVVRAFDKRDIGLVLPPRNRWLYQVDEILRRVISERIAVEDVYDLLAQKLEAETAVEQDENSAAGILGDLGIVDGTADATKAWFSWPNLPTLFSDRNDRSFWWAEPSPKSPPRQIIHSGKPDASLFCLLMDGGVSHGN